MPHLAYPRGELTVSIGGYVVSAKGSVQDAYLKKMTDDQTVVRINLTNGKEVRGKIKQFDAFTVVVAVKNLEVLVYKSAIAAIGPAAANDAP